MARIVVRGHVNLLGCPNKIAKFAKNIQGYRNAVNRSGPAILAGLVIRVLPLTQPSNKKCCAAAKALVQLSGVVPEYQLWPHATLVGVAHRSQVGSQNLWRHFSHR